MGHLWIREDPGVDHGPHPHSPCPPPTPATAALTSFLWALMGLVQMHLSLCCEPLTFGLRFCWYWGRGHLPIGRHPGLIHVQPRKVSKLMTVPHVIPSVDSLGVPFISSSGDPGRMDHQLPLAMAGSVSHPYTVSPAFPVPFTCLALLFQESHSKITYKFQKVYFAENWG